MAKKSTSKKTASKRTVKKTVKAKAAVKANASVKTKSTARQTKKSAVKTKAKKTALTGKAAVAKKPIKQKTIERKTGTKKSMPRKKTIIKETKVEETQAISSAEARAIAIQNIKGYGQGDLDHFRKIILARRDEIIEQLQNLKEQMLDPTTGEYINENSPYSLHMAEQGTDAMEREKTFLYAQRENKFLGYLEDALKRIDAGTYGICIECIDEPQHLCDTCPLIPKARLEAVPHSQLCLPIKQRQEKK